MADYGSIPPELVGVIANKLTTIEDHSALASVCRSYRSATKGEDWRPQHLSQPPWLLLCGRDNDGENPDVTRQRGILSTYRKMKKVVMDLPEIHGRLCWGTPYGWIVTLGLDMKLHLFNPFNRRRIPLPDPGHAYIHRGKVFGRNLLSSFGSISDTDNKFLVVIISINMELRFMRGETWVDVQFLRERPYIRDVVCCRGQIYAVSCNRGELFICSNFDGPGPPTVDEFVPLNGQISGYVCDESYVVESSGELLLVFRYPDRHSSRYKNVKFRVCKLYFETKRWIQIYDLGDNALFVGKCLSISLAQPGNFNCRSNCIYFTDDYAGSQDMGIYDFEEHTIEPFYVGDDSRSRCSAPTWFIPTLT